MPIIHLIYVVDDGITTLRCGVGAIAMNFISVAPDISRRLRTVGFRLRLSVITLSAAPNAIGLRTDLLNRTKEICTSLDGDLHLIKATQSANSVYFNYAQWEMYNRQASRLIESIKRPGDARTIVITNDAIFSHIRIAKTGIRLVWIPHSLSFVHRQSYADQAARTAWEHDAIKYIKKASNGYIGYLSPFVKRTLIDSYSPDHKLVSFANGFNLRRLQKQGPLPRKKVEQYLRRRGIPLNKPLLFSYARADEYKGLEASLYIMKALTKKSRYHGVLIASKFSNEMIVNRVQQRLKKLIRGHEANISAFFGYEFTLPKYVLGYRRTKALLHLPDRDFCPLVPFESELIGHDNLCVINSNLPCFRGLITNLIDGFLVRRKYSQALADTRAIFRMSSKKRQAIIDNGKRRSSRLFNIEENYLSGILSVIE